MTLGAAPVAESAIGIIASGVVDAVGLKPTTVVISTTTVVMESVLKMGTGDIESTLLLPEFPVEPADLATLPEPERSSNELEASLCVPVMDPKKSVSSCDRDLFDEEKDDIDVKTSWEAVPLAVCTGAEPVIVEF
jgi:hypothetical protein